MRKTKQRVDFGKKRYKKWQYILLLIPIGCIVILMSFPFVLRRLGDYCDFCQRVIEMDVLSYYGVAFGILASFSVHIADKKRAQEEEKRRIKPIITLDIRQNGEFSYIATIANRGQRLQRNIYIDGDYVASDIDAGKNLNVNIVISDYDNACNNDYLTVFLCSDKGKLPRKLCVHCTDIRGQIWCHVFNRFEDFNGVHYNLTEREIESEEISVL